MIVIREELRLKDDAASKMTKSSVRRFIERIKDERFNKRMYKLSIPITDKYNYIPNPNPIYTYICSRVISGRQRPNIGSQIDIYPFMHFSISIAFYF